LDGLQILPNRLDAGIKRPQFVRVQPPPMPDMLGNIGAFLAEPADRFAVCLHAETDGVAGADVADVLLWRWLMLHSYPPSTLDEGRCNFT